MILNIHTHTQKEAFAKHFPISLGQICVLTSQVIHHWVKPIPTPLLQG